MSYAQLYLKGYTGYALSTGNEKLTSSQGINVREYPTGKYINEKYESFYRLKFGQGVNLGLGIGYALNKNIAFEITGNTQILSKFKYSKQFWDFDFNPEPEHSYSYDWYWAGFFGDLKYSNTLFQVSPQVVFMSNPYNQWTFYLKGGPDFTWIKYTRTIQQESLTTVKFSGNINTGIQYSFGTEYKLSENISVFAELTTINVRYTFRKSKILQYEIDGVDALNELESTSFNDLDDKISFNHLGLNVGLKYIF